MTDFPRSDFWTVTDTTFYRAASRLFGGWKRAFFLEAFVPSYYRTPWSREKQETLWRVVDALQYSMQVWKKSHAFIFSEANVYATVGKELKAAT